MWSKSWWTVARRKRAGCEPGSRGITIDATGKRADILARHRRFTVVLGRVVAPGAIVP